MNRRELLLSTGAISLTAFITPGIAQTTAEAEPATVFPTIVGNPDATVTLVEYASFTCPHCKRFHEVIYPKLKTDFIDTGKIKFEMREVYFDRLGLWAGMVARCDGPEKYFGMVDLIFQRQGEWARSQDPATVAQNLYKIGRIAGMEDAKMEACLQDRAHAEALVAEYQKNATADNVRSTPSLYLNGSLLDYNNYEELSALITTAIG